MCLFLIIIVSSSYAVSCFAAGINKIGRMMEKEEERKKLHKNIFLISAYTRKERKKVRDSLIFFGFIIEARANIHEAPEGYSLRRRA